MNPILPLLGWARGKPLFFQTFFVVSFYDYKVDVILASLLNSMRDDVLKTKSTNEGSLR